VRGSDLRSLTASRLVLHWCGTSGGVAPSLFPLLATLGGARLRLTVLYSIAACAVARLRLGGVAPVSCPRSAREGGGGGGGPAL